MDELKTIIRALAISNAASGITVSQLDADFKALEGYAIPYASYGFQSLDGMLRTMTDAIQVKGYGLTAVVEPLSNKKSQHVQEMVKRNKPGKKKPFANNRSHGYQRNYRNNAYSHPYYLDLDDGHDDDDYDDNEFDEEIKPTSQLSFDEAYNERQNKREEILAKLDKLKRISVRPSNGGLVVPDSTKTTVETINCSNDPTTNELTIPEDAMPRSQKIVDTLPGQLLQPKASARVVVTSLLNPKHLYIHLAENTDKLTHLAPLIDRIYSTKATGYEWLIPDTMVQVGMYCAAKYHNRWYRAQVKGPVNYLRVLLSYIDYGYLRYVPLADVRFLAKELASLPCQAVRIALTSGNLSGENWSKETCEQLANMVHRKVLNMEVVSVDLNENVLDVILTDPSSCSNGHTDSDKSSLNRQLAMAPSNIV
ncbi:RING finger protein 17-like [Anopheles maculipalpis]|uniref:RING finger protein 17-like n=1 Tax=Anopheles maculipalpis TaxID=1496333 RepID=UPI0021599FC4|nr:RING finger protein 17-like [Anopheles maculipalpis]